MSFDKTARFCWVTVLKTHANPKKVKIDSGIGVPLLGYAINISGSYENQPGKQRLAI